MQASIRVEEWVERDKEGEGVTIESEKAETRNSEMDRSEEGEGQLANWGPEKSTRKGK